MAGYGGRRGLGTVYGFQPKMTFLFCRRPVGKLVVGHQKSTGRIILDKFVSCLPALHARVEFSRCGVALPELSNVAQEIAVGGGILSRENGGFAGGCNYDRKQQACLKSHK